MTMVDVGPAGWPYALGAWPSMVGMGAIGRERSRAGGGAGERKVRGRASDRLDLIPESLLPPSLRSRSRFTSPVE